MQLCLILIEKTKEYEGKQILSREYLYFRLCCLLDLPLYHDMSEQCMSGSQQTDTHLSFFPDILLRLKILFCLHKFFSVYNNFFKAKGLTFYVNEDHPPPSFHLMTPYPSLCCHTGVFLCLPNILYTSSLISPCIMFLLTSSFGNWNLSVCLKIN